MMIFSGGAGLPMPRDVDDPSLSQIVPVILAGGGGRRLWPLSTPSKPKPFLKLLSRRSLLQKTADRVTSLRKPYIICNERHRGLVIEQVDAEQILLEPCGRGTAPAIAAAAYYVSQNDDPLLLVMPSDHEIKQPELLLEAVKGGVDAARQGWLVTFGITPHGPSPHFGYIQAGREIGENIYEVDAFEEKPDKVTARGYLKSGGYFWNSGIFLFSARTYLESLAAQQPEIAKKSCEAVKFASRLQQSICLNKDAFSACPGLSIDYAVMENAPKRAVVPVSMKWRDLGTWPSLLAALVKK